MVIATFGPSTAWHGKSITFEGGQFVLEGHGPITAAGVADYDRQGHLQWAYDGLREWTYETAGLPAPPVVPAPPAAAPPAAPAVEVTAVTAVAAAAPATAPTAPVTPTPTLEAAPVETPAAEAPSEVPPDVPPVTPPVAPPAAPVASETPSAPQPADAVAQPAAAAVAKPRPRWIVPVIAAACFIVLVIGWTLILDGRWRDGFGAACFIMALVFVVLIIWTLVRPRGGAQAWFPGLGKGAALIVAGVLCAACFVLAGVLWWMPHYEVVVPADTRIVLDDSPDIVVTVANHGVLGGTYSGAYAVDGVEQANVDVPLGGGQSRTVTMTLPSTAERGAVVVSLGGTSIAAQALTPPSFSVSPLEVEPAIALKGDAFAVKATVENSGDVAGTFDGVLLANGAEIASDPVKVGPGATGELSYTIDGDAAGTFGLAVGDAEGEVVVVKPKRPGNGEAILRRVSGGRASLTVKNSNSVDAMVVLTRTSNLDRPVLTVYVRKDAKAKITGIPDGKYVVWNSIGTDWNAYQGDFYAATEHKRWKEPLDFSTSRSTNRWTDANYIHTRTTTSWQNWTITLGSGPSKYTRIVPAEAFPTR
jgi:hypothetical protein